jgi:hypothetical protein
LHLQAILKIGHFFSQCTEGAPLRLTFPNPDLYFIAVTRCQEIRVRPY